MSDTNWVSMCCNITQDIVYTVSHQGGIFKSVDFGANFVNVYNDFTSVQYFVSISCDNTGNYVICGCNGKMLCSSTGGYEFTIFAPPEFSNGNIKTCCMPVITSEPDGTQLMYICYYASATIFGQIYYDSATNTYELLQFSNISFISGICITNSYLILASRNEHNIKVYAVPEGKVLINRNTPYRTIYATYNVNDNAIITCNENYFAIQTFDTDSITPTYNYKLLRTSITDETSTIFNIDLGIHYLRAITMTFDNHIYGITSKDTNNKQNIKKFSFVGSNAQETTLLSDIETPPQWVSICTNAYYEFSNNDIFLYAGTDESYIYWTNTEFSSYTSAGITCFLENTKIKILKDNKIIEENIQNLKINDNVLISNNETRKLIFIGYNYFTPHNLKYVAKIKKDSIGLNEPNNDLFILTGHSLLFKEIPENIKNEHYNEKIYNTPVFDNYNKIIALHTTIYETPQISELNIENNKIKYFHFALENNNLDEHYGIYSNNTLTETMTINHIEKSNLMRL